MLDDVAEAVERGQNVNKAKHLHLEILIAHRERHDALIKAGLAKKRLRMLVHQLENAVPASLDFRLERAHA